MKKVLLLIASVILLAACVIIPASAAADPMVSVNSTPAVRGEEVTFTASLGTEVEVVSGAVAVSYDANTLEYVSYQWNVGTTILQNFDTVKNKGVFAYDRDVSSKISGTIFTIKFKVKDSAPFGNSEIKLDVQLTDVDGLPIIVTNRSGQLTVNCKHSFTKQDTTSNYLESKATCTSAAKYYYSCIHCGEKGSETFSYGSTSSHDFTATNASEKYIATKASCTEKATYYHSCTACGLAGTTTFVSGNFAPHVYDKEVVKESYFKSAADCDNPAYYYFSCKCGEKGSTTFAQGSKLGHTGGTATCTAKAVCTRCYQQYGSTKSHSYVNEVVDNKYLISPASCQGPAKYYKSCECGLAGTASFTSGSKTDHVFDQRNTNEIYLVKKASCTEKSVYVFSCKCGAKGTDTFEYAGASGHQYSTELSKDKDNHWYECSLCHDKKDLAPHKAGPAATEQNPQTCTECLYVIAPALEHKHNYSTSEWTSDYNSHWHACSGCSDRKDETNHSYDNSCDVTCNVCGYERGIMHTYKVAYNTDKVKHWHECTVCGKTINEGEHIAGPEATEYDAQTCTVCGYVLAPALGHEHKVDTENDSWVSDENEHWYECECGEKEHKEEHAWNEGEITVEPTEKEEGEKVLTCTVCGATKTVVVDKVAPATTPAKTTAAITFPEYTDDFEYRSGCISGGCSGCGGCGGTISLGAIAFLVIGAAGVVLTAKKKED